MARREIFPSMAGIKIVPMEELPIDSWAGLEAKRMVRHGLKDVLDWLNEPVGEEPGDKVHKLMHKNTLYCSPHLFVLIASGVVGEFVNGEKDGVI